MEFYVPCECGQHLAVSEGAAGTEIGCTCGRTVHIPSLGALREHSLLQDEAPSPPRPRYSAGQFVLLVVGMIAFGSVFIFGLSLSLAGGNLMGIGWLAYQLAQIWLIILIARECHPDAIFYALMIPFFTWYFGYQRWDIAKVPLLFSVGGFLWSLVTAGLA